MKISQFSTNMRMPSGHDKQSPAKIIITNGNQSL